MAAQSQKRGGHGNHGPRMMNVIHKQNIHYIFIFKGYIYLGYIKKMCTINVKQPYAFFMITAQAISVCLQQQLFDKVNLNSAGDSKIFN